MENCPNRLFALICGLAWLFFAQSGLAEAYRWVDEDGNVQFSERVPPEVSDAERLRSPPRVDTEAVRRQMEKRERERSLLEKKQQRQQKRQMEQAEDEADAAKLAASCRSARSRVPELQRPRVNRVSKDGTYTRMPEEERVAELQRVQKYLRKNCDL